MINFFLPVDDEGQSGCLYAADAQHLMTASLITIFDGIESGAVHAKNPVANGTTQPRKIEFVILLLIFQLPESLLYGFICHRRDPQPLDGTFHTGFLHDPALDQLTFLTGIATVYNAIRLGIERLNDTKLLFDSLIIDQLDSEALRNHGQLPKTPMLPQRGIVVWLLQFAQMTKSPSHLIAITFHVTLMLRVGT